MHLQGSTAKKAALILLLADAAFGEPLTTIQPCKEASNPAWPAITVTSQYQPVSTCSATTACVKGKCSTIYPFTTYPYVSTVVPCAWDGTTTQKSTVTDVTQPFRVSEHHETLTTITAVPTTGRHWVDWLARKKPESSSVTLYETVTKRAVAPFNECGPLAIPGWEGSGLCKKCEDLEDGSRAQLLDVVECRSGVDASGKAYEKCAEWYETWISRPAPTSTVTASARCSSQGKIHSAGTYTWTFPQTAPPVTITAPPRTVTITISGRKTVTVDPKFVYTIPGRHWNAYVTKSFSGATTFNFNVFITKVIIFNIPNYTKPATNTRHVPIPTGSQGKHGDGWWPLPNKNGGDSYYGGDAGKGWADWAPETKTATVTKTNSKSTTYASPTSTSYTSSLGPIYQTTSTSTSTSTLSTSSTSVSASTSSSSTSSFSLSLGPIQQSTTSSSSSSFSLSLGPIQQSTTSSSSSSFSLSLGPIQQSTTSSSSSSFSLTLGPIQQSTTTSTSSVSTTTSSPRAIDSPIQGTTTTTSVSASTSTSSVSTTSSVSFSVNPIGASTTSSSSSSLSSSTSASSTSSSLSTSSSSSFAVGPVGGSTTSSSTSASSTSVDSSTTSSTSSFTIGPIGGSTTSSSSSASSTSVDSSTTSASSTSVDSSTTSSTSSFAIGPIGGSTTASSSTTTFVATTLSSTTSAPATTTTAAGPVCNLNVNICLNAQLITANTVVTQGCPLGIGLLCSLNQLLTVAAQLITNNPNVLSTVIGNNQVLGLSITPQQVQAGILDGSLTSVCQILGTTSVVINDPTCPINPVTTSSSASITSSASLTSATGSSTTSSALATTTTAAGGPICNLAISVCPNANQLIAATITTVQCPLGIGLLCTLNQLLDLVPQLLQNNPNVLSVVLGNNQILGLSITPQQVQALALQGVLTSTCTALQQISVVVQDPTCPISQTTTSSSVTVASSTTLSTITTLATTTTASAPATTTTTTAAGGGGGAQQQCGVVVQLCAGQTLQSLGLNQVSCSLGIPILCTLTQILTDVTNACAALPGGCLSQGRIGTGLNILGATGLTGTQSITSIQAAIAGVQNCQPGGQVLTLSDPGCPANLFKRHGAAGLGRSY